MARRAQDREDLLRDATAYPTRLQLRSAQGESRNVVFAGFRANGAASLYFDQDPVYHFNASGLLRRAFVGGKLMKAEQGRLITLLRQEGDEEIALLRNELSNDEQQLFCETAQQQLAMLHEGILGGRYAIEGQVRPDPGDPALQQLVALLEELGEIRIAETPHVAG